MNKTIFLFLVFAAFAMAIAFPVLSDNTSSSSSTSSSMSGKSGANVSITAKLVNENQLAKEKMAMVSVQVSGVTISEMALQRTLTAGMHTSGSGYGTTGSTTTGEESASGTSGTGSTGMTGTTGSTGSTGTGTSSTSGTAETPSGTSSTAGTGSMGMSGSAGTSHASLAAAHLHYQLDNGPIVATSAKTLEFANLTSGSHTITVYVADASHTPLSDQKTLTVTVP